MLCASFYTQQPTKRTRSAEVLLLPIIGIKAHKQIEALANVIGSPRGEDIPRSVFAICDLIARKSDCRDQPHICCNHSSNNSFLISLSFVTMYDSSHFGFRMGARDDINGTVSSDMTHKKKGHLLRNTKYPDYT